MARLFRTGGSFVTVLVAYWAYTLLAVPLIEPPAERYQSDHASDDESSTWGRGANGPWPKALQGLFPPGSWELENPIKLDLGPTEFRLLRHLVLHPNRPFTREELIEAVWGYEGTIGSPRTVDVHIRHLREKLEADPAEPRWLVTLRGVGYLFEPP